MLKAKPEDKKAAAENFLEVVLPKFLSTAEELLRKSGGKFFVANKVFKVKKHIC